MGENGVPTLLHPETQWNLLNLYPESLRNLNLTQVQIRFEHVIPNLALVSCIYCNLYIWNAFDDIIVSDIDGTITRSDVKGHLNTTVLQKAGFQPKNYAHKGVCSLFSSLQAKLQARFLFLTARPLNLVIETRDFLQLLVQNEDKKLPVGPCITDDSSYAESIQKEVGGKSDEFKTDYLVKLKELVLYSRLQTKSSSNQEQRIYNHVFLGGFGNKETDGLAYERAGIHPLLTFIINSDSKVKYLQFSLDSYDDPVLEKEFIEKSIQLRETGKL